MQRMGEAGDAGRGRLVGIFSALALMGALQSACSEGPAAGDDASAAAADAASASDSAADVSADVLTADAEAAAVDAAAVDAAEASVDVSPVDVGPCPIDGVDCDDGDPCSAGDRCKAGVCLAGAIQLCECEADADCLLGADLCAGKPVCKLGVFPYRCGVAPGTAVVCDPTLDNACQTSNCHPATGACTPLAKPNGTACQDGKPCTLDDACKSGACVAGANVCQCENDKDCAGFDDGDACNGALACDKFAFPHVCKVVPSSIPVCDPAKSDLCNVHACDPKSGACKDTPKVNGKICDDGDPCSVGEDCQAGSCTGGIQSCMCKIDTDCGAFEDGNACNGSLICSKNVCVVDTKTIVTCDAKSDTACSQNQCQPKTGTCTQVAAEKFAFCDDGDPCTAGDGCDGGLCKPGTDICQCKQNADCGAFEDGNACNGTLICSKFACALDAKTLVTCDGSADTPCLKNACQPKAGTCAQVATATGFPCSDGEPCTVGDACAAGDCKPGSDVCQCKIDSDCQASDDGDLCNGTLMCKQNKCVINPATLVSCPNAPPCKQVACTAKTGLCETAAVADGVGCDDGDACTPNDACQNGACKGGPTTCGGPTWAEVYKLAIQGNGCSGCHGGYGSQSQAYQTVINGFHCGGKLVVPGNAAASTFVAKMVQGVPLSCGDKMPDGTSGISKAAGDALQAWINAGAKP